MMRQIKGRMGCKANPYVYDDNSRFIDGPQAAVTVRGRPDVRRYGPRAGA